MDPELRLPTILHSDVHTNDDTSTSTTSSSYSTTNSPHHHHFNQENSKTYFEQLSQPSCPAKLIEPPPLESLRYSHELTASSLLPQSSSKESLSSIESSDELSSNSNNSNGFVSTTTSQEQQPPTSPNESFSTRSTSSTQNNNSKMTVQQQQQSATTTTTSTATHVRSHSNSFASVSVSKITHNTDHLQYRFNPREFTVVGNRIEKSVDKSYSSAFLDAPIGTVFNGKVKWKVRILALHTWLAVGVTSAEVVVQNIFNLSPYHKNYSYLYSANGYVWNYQKEEKLKYDQVKQTCGVGDIIILELCTERKELTIYKNEIKIVSIPNIVLPVYPAFVSFGYEQMEMVNFLYQPIELPKFIIPSSGFFVDKQKVSKTSDSNYASVFVSKLLDGLEKCYKWKIKVVNLNTWIGFGVVMSHIPEKQIHNLSPYDEHCTYMMSANGFIWNPSKSGSKKYKHVYSKNIENGDVISIELNCSKKELLFFKGNSKIASISSVKLPVYPAIMMYGHESVEFSFTT